MKLLGWVEKEQATAEADPYGDDKQKDKSNNNGKDEIQGSLHCATDGETVRCFGRDDVFWGASKKGQGLGRRWDRRASAVGWVLRRSSLVSQARRSWVMPWRIWSSSSVAWASVLMTILQPCSLARRRWRSLRSARAGEALCSTATPSSAARLRIWPMWMA